MTRKRKKVIVRRIDKIPKRRRETLIRNVPLRNQVPYKKNKHRQKWFGLSKEEKWKRIGTVLYGIFYISYLIRISVLSFQYGQSLIMGFLTVSFVLLMLGSIFITILQRTNKNYSSPIWIVSLGLITTFIGFTLSGSFQEVVQDKKEKTKIIHRLYSLTEESKLQRDGIERTLDDFSTVLFEENNSNNEQTQFYVRKQLSVYNESDVKDILFSDFDIIDKNKGNREFSTLINNTGNISEIYNDLTFKSTDPKEMLQSYFELISLYYQADERVSILSMEYQYINDGDWKKAEKGLKKSRRENKEYALKSINKTEKLIKTYYPNINMDIDKEKLLK